MRSQYCRTAQKPLRTIAVRTKSFDSANTASERVTESSFEAEKYSLAVDFGRSRM
jgi:hypothetical protein